MERNFLFAFCILNLTVFSQKQLLDFAAVEKWPQINGAQISSDGKWLTYQVYHNNQPDSIVLKKANSKWQLSLSPADDVVFTADSRFFIMQRSDSLLLYDLKQQKWKQAISGISSFLIPAGNGRWIAYQTKSPDATLVLHDLQTGRNKQYNSVSYYRLSDDGTVLLLKTDPVIEGQKTSLLKWISLTNGKESIITKNSGTANNFVFNNSNNALAFTSAQSLYYFKKGMDSAAVIINDDVPILSNNNLTAVVKFSPDGNRIIFTVKKKEVQKKENKAAGVNIWNYGDDYLPTEQTARTNYLKNRNYTCVLDLNDYTITQLDEEDDEANVDAGTSGSSNFVLLKQNVNFFGGKWRPSTIPSYYVKNIKTGEHKLLTSQKDVSVNISPTGKYIIWFDPAKQIYFSYETAMGNTKNITGGVTVSFLPSYQALRIQPYIPFGIAGWLKDDDAVLIYDQFDIWKIDPKGERSAVNCTNSYGRKHNIVLRIWNENGNDYAIPEITSKEVLLVAFDPANKNNGFYKKNVTNNNDPLQLTLDPCLYYAHRKFNLQFLESPAIIKAKNAGTYLLCRMNSNEYPNLLVTNDFKTFQTVSDLHPEQDYNWLTTELVSWKQDDGTSVQGVLYKPQNFVPGKKYPLIFYFYEKLSHRLHQYIDPALSNGTMNIPYYVSNGYLVFTPDMNYKAGMPGEGALNAVVSAARQLSKLPFVDSTKMGLQGHSFGGYEVNYIVSHCNLFAAAQESAGASDFISYYNGFYRESSAQFYFEYGQGRIGSTLWETPDLYIKNSPIFNAQNVQTPLLIMHNKEDGEVPFQQGLEWFTGLKRLGKKVWMLQYDNEHHGIDQRKNQLDFSIRTKQFFDHYLKGVPEPDWMTTGLSGTVKN